MHPIVPLALAVAALLVLGGGGGGESAPAPARRQLPPPPEPAPKSAVPARAKASRPAAPPPEMEDEGVPEDAPGFFDTLYDMGKEFYDWLMSPLRPTGRIDDVMNAFEESKGVPYSYGGGYPPDSAVWPRGGPGLRGGIGWDCSGWTRAVMLRSPNPPEWAKSSRYMGATRQWEAAGRPMNGTSGAAPGDLIFWANGEGKIIHVGFVTGKDSAVSAFGPGRKANGDLPRAKVKAHSFAATGLRVVGTAPW